MQRAYSAMTVYWYNFSVGSVMQTWGTMQIAGMAGQEIDDAVKTLFQKSMYDLALLYFWLERYVILLGIFH